MKISYYKNYIQTHFGNVHKNNLKNYEIMYKYYRKNYGKFLPKNRETPILDVGCGTGEFLYFLKKYGYKHYIGIDISKECVEWCLQQGLGNKKNIFHSDVKNYLLKTKQKFSVIVMNDVIEHIEKKEIVPILVIAKKSLKKRGKLIIKVVNSSNPITASSSRYYDFTHAVGFTEESLFQVLRLAGFKKINIYPQDIFVFNPIINLVGKLIQGVFNFAFRVLFLAYGRKTTKIFTKDIIAVAEK